MKSATAATTALVTVAEYRQLPEPADGAVLELWHGEVVRLTRPKKLHLRIQHRLQDLLATLAGSAGFVAVELPFRAEPEHDLRCADVAFVSAARWNAVPDDGDLMGAPELVIEVESPSNTAAELKDKQLLCLANGCQEFWTVYPKLELVEVATADGIRHYRRGDSIPFRVFPGATLAVDDIFA